VTCTPYSVNTHRLLVRGERVPYDPDEKDSEDNVITTEGSMFFFGYRLSYWTIGGIIVGFMLFVAVLSALIITIARGKKRRKTGRYKQTDL